MKQLRCMLVLLCMSTITSATVKDSTILYPLPDSVTAIAFMAEISVQNVGTSKHFLTGIQTNFGSLYFSKNKDKKSLFFGGHERSRMVVTGIGARAMSFGRSYFEFLWEEGKKYKLLIAMASDSASSTSLFSAYLFLPDENKWKFIGTRRHPFYNSKLTEPAIYFRAHKKSQGTIAIGDLWCQRSNGSWRNLKEGNQPAPVINFFGHIDSIAQRQLDIKIITDSIQAGKTDATKNIEGVYYAILKEGSGRQVSVNDTVVAHYKGYLFTNGQVFDQTSDKPATFPLKRLIRAWQIGVPLLKVGGKIRLVIPSDMAYSIRTRSAKIPPNSILVFEIEVVDARSPQ